MIYFLTVEKADKSSPAADDERPIEFLAGGGSWRSGGVDPPERSGMV